MSIGIQAILPKTRTSPRARPLRPAKDRDSDEASAADQQEPPPDGMGKHMDKTV